MKSPSILFLILLQYAYASPGGSNNRYEPFLKLRNLRTSAVKKFPFADTQSLNEGSVIEKYLCPAETDEDVANMEVASKYDYKLKYCLFRKKFEKNEDRVCKQEVKPVLLELPETKNSNNKEMCGFLKHQVIYSLSYYDCGDMNVLQHFQNETIQKNPRAYNLPYSYKMLHDICYNSAKKSVAWTIHRVDSPQLFQNPYFENQQEPLETEISTDSYFMDSNLFSILKEQYELEKLKDTSKPGTFVMVPRPLIPPEHYALSMHKKATNHYLNMAPLWENLAPLMTAINQGIRQAQITLEKEDSEFYNDLMIHTKVTLPNETDTSFNTWFNLLLFQGNIWYKFVYRKKVELAVLIVIHNTPGNPPSNGCFVGKQMKCDFQKWSNDEQTRSRITSDEMQYAFCCQVGARDVRSIFNYDYEISNYLQIESLLLKRGSSTSTI